MLLDELVIETIEHVCEFVGKSIQKCQIALGQRARMFVAHDGLGHRVDYNDLRRMGIGKHALPKNWMSDTWIGP
ncbi:MAG: hypothetical protein U0905_19855 [Pirellulales bacterium]